MSVGNRFSKSVAPSLVGSITLPDGQQFFSDKLINMSLSTSTITLNLSSTVAPLSYVATNPAVALLLMQAIQNAVASPTTAGIVLEESQASASVAITAIDPSPIPASTLTALTVTGYGFLGLSSPTMTFVDSVGGVQFLATNGGSGDTNLAFTVDATPAGAYTAILYDGPTYLCEFAVTVA